jgi:DNA-binding SARP family transcriptional activator/Tfp pilus assembly protein PilF
MWFGVLGPLLVCDGDRVIGVRAPLQRVLLAALLVRTGELVPADTLAEMVWDGAPPGGAEITLRSHVSRLRQVLGPSAGARVVTRFRGYAIEAAEDEVDLSRFRVLARDGGAAGRAGEWAQAWKLLAEALGLWRAEPFQDVASELLRREQLPGLDVLRLQAVEWQMDAGLQLGRHSELVAELESLTVAWPLRERFHGQLMLALAHCGRQAEALEAYQRARLVLAEQLGAEPGAELRELHQQLLTASDVPGSQRSAARAAGGPALVPRQLPAAVGGFTGRAGELAALAGMLDQASSAGPGTVVISAIGGMAGVGKTALALHWAHQAASRFGDGQLYVNLRGFDPSGSPITAAEAIRGFLDVLGVPAERVPPTVPDQAGLYRSLLAGKRVLIVLDNARDEQQVRPLLPASPGSLVLVTSRSQLGGLGAADGARLINVDVLSQAEAVDMLAARLGAARAAAEPGALDQIARLCGCLPLALAVAAARAAARPAFPLAALAGELADSADRLDALDTGDPGSSVRAVFSWSAGQLSAGATRMFRLLGLHPGPDISIPAAASLAATAQPQARHLLDELARGHLITEHLPGRYAFHDLLRSYAAEQARIHDSQDERDAATGRVLDHYLHTAAAATRLLDTSEELVVLVPLRPGAAAAQPADHAQALAWFESEHQVLLAGVALAAASGLDSHAWQLAWAVGVFLQIRGHWQDWAATQRTALAAATRRGDAAAQAKSGRLLAIAHAHLGDHDQALAYYADSLTLYQRLGDRLGEAKVQQNLGGLAERQHRYADALGHAEQMLRLYQAIGDPALEAEALNNVGWCHATLGDYEQARVLCQQAVALCAETDHPWIEGATWDSLGYVEHQLGRLAEAVACYQRALAFARERGDRFYEAETLTRLGDTHHAAGGLAQASQAWLAALPILEGLQHPSADQVRAKLAKMNDRTASNAPG